MYYTNEDNMREAQYRLCNLREDAEKQRRGVQLRTSTRTRQTRASRSIVALLAIIALPKS